MTPISLEGQTLGKYRVLDALGRGGMARVYRAYHPQLDRYVAIKVLRSDLMEEHEFLARFRREAQAVAALRHPNIVQAFDFDVEGDTTYMVMELLEGDTLKARMNDYRARRERMPLGEMVRILLDVLDGLAYAHSEGMIHRDVKPANVMLTKRGQAVITDFGIAHIVGGTRHTASGALMGTLNYIAPEQGLEGVSDARSDIYSLGIVFYEMLTGHPPFDADTPLAILMKHLNDPLPLPRQIDADIPEPFERVVLKALAKNPAHRYQSAEEMAQAVRQAADEAQITLPSRISLPLSFTTATAPSESVAIFSGAARERIADAAFAGDETDVTLNKRATKKAARKQKRQPEPLPDVSLPLIGSLNAFSVGQAIWSSLGIIFFWNMFALTGAGITNQWELFEIGWPAELFLVSLALSLLMAATAAPGLLFPIGIIFGNGFLFLYYTFTNNWSHWAFLWPLELIIIGGTVFFAIRIIRDAAQRRQTARFVAVAVAFVSILMVLIIMAASFPIHVVRSIIRSIF
ncbi:MAG: protein kinase [Anaerolineae bacterium]|nr:protein kinase [Anaerolineae bacterium]